MNKLNIITVTAGPPEPCQLCGTVAECRPYGPNRERICFTCAMKDEAITRRQMFATPSFQELRAALQGGAEVVDMRTKEHEQP